MGYLDDDYNDDLEFGTTTPFDSDAPIPSASVGGGRSSVAESYADTVGSMVAPSTEQVGDDIGGYARAVSVPKGSLLTVLKACEGLMRVATTLVARNIVIYSDTQYIYLKYSNTPYTLVYRVDNGGGKVMGTYSIPIVQLRRLTDDLEVALNLVEEDGKLYVLFGGNLVCLETLGVDEASYAFGFNVGGAMVDRDYIKHILPSYVGLLGLSERKAEQMLLTYGGWAYVNVGSILGRAKPFFGDTDCSVPRLVAQCMVGLVLAVDADIIVGFSDNLMRLSIGDVVCLEVPVQTKAANIKNFMSPLLQGAFSGDAFVGVNTHSFSRLLQGLLLTEYKDVLQLTFESNRVVVEAYSKGGALATYTFNYMRGTMYKSVVTVSMSLLSGILKGRGEQTQFSVTDKGLIVDTGVVMYCLRQVQSVG